ncbi:MAG: hypothetical protein M1829_002648 [Trizodia sp. TS-e1964]|nr:MAG: hypothetical protein M1829_002648 [Trizodia sp. TS-e1964]
MDTLSALEMLPLELLDRVFVGSANPELALLSHRLHAQLSQQQHLQPAMVKSMLASNDPTIQSNLLSRRFFTPELFDQAAKGLLAEADLIFTSQANGFFHSLLFCITRHIEKPLVCPRFRFASGVRLCARVLCGTETEILDPLLAQSKGLRRIRILSRLIFGGVDLKQVHSTQTADATLLQSAAMRGLQQALDRPCATTVFLLTFGWDEDRVGTAVPSLDMIKSVVMGTTSSSDLAGYMLAAHIPAHFNPHRLENHPIYIDKEFRKWIDNRIETDEKNREAQALARKSGLPYFHSLYLWKGQWVDYCLGEPKRNYPYRSFVRKRRPADEPKPAVQNFYSLVESEWKREEAIPALAENSINMAQLAR